MSDHWPILVVAPRAGFEPATNRATAGLIGRPGLSGPSIADAAGMSTTTTLLGGPKLPIVFLIRMPVKVFQIKTLNSLNYIILRALAPWCRAALGITPCGTRTAAGGAVPGLG
jgi:hypothetical protein